MYPTGDRKDRNADRNNRLVYSSSGYSRIIQSVAKRLGVPEEKFPMNMEQYGNTSAASIPILLDEMNKKGMLQPGQKIILSGFGAGLTWGAAQIEW